MTEWISVKTRLPKPYREVDVWMVIHASPLSFGIGDSFRVPDVTRRYEHVDGTPKWMHMHEGSFAELRADAITHWMPTPKPPSKRPKKRGGAPPVVESKTPAKKG